MATQQKEASRSEEQLSDYLSRLAQGKYEEYNTPAARSLQKWEVLIQWAEEHKAIPPYGGACGLCFERMGYRGFQMDCKGEKGYSVCPLYVDGHMCGESQGWLEMDEATIKFDWLEWLKGAKKFYKWMKRRLEGVEK